MSNSAAQPEPEQEEWNERKIMAFAFDEGSLTAPEVRKATPLIRKVLATQRADAEMVVIAEFEKFLWATFKEKGFTNDVGKVINEAFIEFKRKRGMKQYDS